MITVFVNDGSLYEFRSPKDAGNWINSNPELYDFDTDNIWVVSDRKLDVPIIEVLSKTITIECKSCEAHLQMETYREEFAVVCPACGVRNYVKI